MNIHYDAAGEKSNTIKYIASLVGLWLLQFIMTGAEMTDLPHRRIIENILCIFCPMKVETLRYGSDMVSSLQTHYVRRF